VFLNLFFYLCISNKIRFIYYRNKYLKTDVLKIFNFFLTVKILKFWKEFI